jgi:hypothetical protein
MAVFTAHAQGRPRFQKLMWGPFAQKNKEFHLEESPKQSSLFFAFLGELGGKN